MKIEISTLEKIVSQALANQGYSEDEIAVIGEILLYAQLRGNNQGVIKLIGNGIPKDPNAGEIRVLRETPISALIDGNHNFGMIVMSHAAEIVLEKAKKNGFGIVGTNNTESSTGAIGYYADKVARQDLVAFVSSGSFPAVAPYGAYEPVFGTNPLSIGLPGKTGPIVLDMATSEITYFGLVESKTAGRKIPSGIAYNRNGEDTNDPAEALHGAIKTFGGHRGSGLSFMIEVMTGSLVGASSAGLGRGDWGNLIFAIDPTLFVDIEYFYQDIQHLVEKMHSAKKLQGITEIFLPGERENARYRMNISDGKIELEDNLYQQLLEAARA